MSDDIQAKKIRALRAMLEEALREMQHVKSHGFKCAGLDGAIARAKQTLDACEP